MENFDFKNASKQELKIKYNEIAKKIGDDQFFTKKELHYLLPNIDLAWLRRFTKCNRLGRAQVARQN